MSRSNETNAKVDQRMLKLKKGMSCSQMNNKLNYDNKNVP